MDIKKDKEQGKAIKENVNVMSYLGLLGLFYTFAVEINQGKLHLISMYLKDSLDSASL